MFEVFTDPNVIAALISATTTFAATVYTAKQTQNSKSVVTLVKDSDCDRYSDEETQDEANKHGN